MEVLDKKTYEYYEFRLNGKSLTKWNLNEDLKEIAPSQKSYGMSQLIITNANQTGHDLSDTNFACSMSNDGQIVTLKHAYDAANNTLNITSTDGSSINFFNLNSIQYGNSALDVNLCDPSTQYYRTSDGKLPDLTGNSATFNLTSGTPDALRDLTMTMSLLAGGSVNIKYTYANTTGTKAPFEVPSDIIDVDRSVAGLNQTGVLSDFVSCTQADPAGPLKCEVSNGKGAKRFSLNGFLLAENLNVMDTIAHTYISAPDDGSYKGVMGLSEQVSSDLFLPDGVYSLWARDQPDPVQTGK
jgi:hypothetical protein